MTRYSREEGVVGTNFERFEEPVGTSLDFAEFIFTFSTNSASCMPLGYSILYIKK